MKLVPRLAATALSAITLTAAPALAQSVTPLPQLDLNRLPGTWYEIAHLPTKSEAKCVSNPLVLYALDDKPSRLQIVFTCRRSDRSTDASNSTARYANKIKPGQVSDGRFKIPFFLPYFLAKKYWVLALADDNSWALVGTPNHKTMQILSKSQTLPAGTLSAIESRAAAQGYSVAKLIQLPVSR